MLGSHIQYTLRAAIVFPGPDGTPLICHCSRRPAFLQGIFFDEQKQVAAISDYLFVKSYQKLSRRLTTSWAKVVGENLAYWYWWRCGHLTFYVSLPAKHVCQKGGDGFLPRWVSVGGKPACT